MSLFGAHDRNKSPTVGSGDHVPLGFIARILGWFLPCTPVIRSACWFFAASQLSVVMLLYGVTSFRWEAGAICDLDAFGFIGMRLHQCETECRSSSASACNRCSRSFFVLVRRSDPCRFFIHSSSSFGRLRYFVLIGTEPIDSLSPSACSMQPKSSSWCRSTFNSRSFLLQVKSASCSLCTLCSLGWHGFFFFVESERPFMRSSLLRAVIVGTDSSSFS